MNLPTTTIELVDTTAGPAAGETGKVLVPNRVLVNGTEVLVEKDGIQVIPGDPATGDEAALVVLKLLPTTFTVRGAHPGEFDETPA